MSLLHAVSDIGAVALARGLRVQRLREYDVQREPILLKAIAQAAAEGYAFDADLPNKRRDEERQQRWRREFDGIPVLVFLQAFEGLGLTLVRS